MTSQLSPNDYYILKDEFSLYFIPAWGFEQYFILVNGIAKQNKRYEWHPMSGGLDTYMQSYELNGSDQASVMEIGKTSPKIYLDYTNIHQIKSD